MFNPLEYLYLLSIKDMGHGLLLGCLLLIALPKVWQVTVLNSLTVLSPICLFLAISIALAYLIFPNYFDHAEPTVATIGQIVATGGIAYPTGDQWQFNGLVYSPGIYVVNSLAVQLADPVLGSKLAGVLAYIMSLCILWRRLPNHLSRAGLVLIFCFYEFGFWNRPESYLLLLSTLAVALMSSRSTWGLLGIGLLAGLATTFKFTGFLFFIPIAIYFLLTGQTFRQLWVAVFVGITIAALPYALSSFSLVNHFSYVQSLATQTLSNGLLQRNLAYALFSILPIVWLWFALPSKSSTKKVLGLMIISVMLTECVVCIVASKPGAGPHHLLPGLPIKLWLIHELTLNKDEMRQGAVRFLGLVMWSMSLYYISYGYPKFLKNYFISIDYVQEQFKAKNELLVLLKKYPNAYMGVTDSKHENYALSFLRPHAFTQDYADKLDPVSFMEVSFTKGTDDRLFVSKMEKCSYASVILPARGQAFSLLNFYTTKPLYSDALRKVFALNYRLIEKAGHFNVYECNQMTAS